MSLHYEISASGPEQMDVKMFTFVLDLFSWDASVFVCTSSVLISVACNALKKYPAVLALFYTDRKLWFIVNSLIFHNIVSDVEVIKEWEHFLRVFHKMYKKALYKNITDFNILHSVCYKMCSGKKHLKYIIKV